MGGVGLSSQPNVWPGFGMELRMEILSIQVCLWGVYPNHSGIWMAKKKQFRFQIARV